MCLPRIDRIVSIEGDEAVMERFGPTSLLCVPMAEVGDHVMIHAGYAIQILDAGEAVERRSMIEAVRGERPLPLESAGGSDDQGHDRGS